MSGIKSHPFNLQHNIYSGSCFNHTSINIFHIGTEAPVLEGEVAGKVGGSGYYVHTTLSYKADLL